MTPEITITTERIDDFPLLLGTMISLGLPGILDRHRGRHGLHQGLSWGWIATIWLAHIHSLNQHYLCPLAQTGATAQQMEKMANRAAVRGW